MKSKWIILIALGLVIVTGLAIALTNKPQEIVRSGKKQTIAVTFRPLELIAKEIAGDDFEVINILPPGASPHTFEPTPDLVLKLKNAEVIFMIGHGLDDWALTLAKNVPKAKIVTVDQTIALRETAKVVSFGKTEEDDEHGPTDPHYWLTAPNAKKIANNIADQLKLSNPANNEAIEERRASFSERMDDLDGQIKALFREQANNAILTHHNAWQYFASEYGLVVVGTVEPSPGKELTANEMKSLQDIIKKDRIKILFIEPELSQQVSEALAKDLKLQIKTLDPEGEKDITDYADLLMRISRTIAESL